MMKQIDTLKEITMKLVKLALVGIVLAISTSSFAISGYKDFEFGMDINKAKEIYKCKWSKENYKLLDIIAGYYTCDKYKFNGKHTDITLVYSPDKKLVRVVIDVPGDMAKDVLKGLKDKYVLTSTPPDEAFKEISPKTLITYGFNNGDVSFQIYIDEDLKDNYKIMYTDTPTTKKLSEYHNNKRIKQESQLKNDI